MKIIHGRFQKFTSWMVPDILQIIVENEAEMHQFLKIWLFAIFCVIPSIKILLGQEETNNFSFMTFLENWYLLKQIQKNRGSNWFERIIAVLCLYIFILCDILNTCLGSLQF